MEKIWEIRGDKIVSVTYFGNDGCGSDETEVDVCTIQDKSYARRIVACVNACRDMDMTVLEMPDYSVKVELDTLDAQIAGRLKAEADAIKNAVLYLEASRDIRTLTAQRDSLLSALRALYGWQRAEVEHFGATIPDDFIIEMVEKALKSAEGK